MNQLTLQQDIDRMAALVRQVADEGHCREPITEVTRFVEDVGMESINRLMLMTLIEQEFGVSLEQHMGSLIELHTVGDTVRFVRSLRDE